MLELIPISLAEAKAFTYAHHRHNPITPPSWRFGVGVAVDGQLVGVALVGRPSSRKLSASRPRTVEITRTCTTGERNANSILYGAACRAAGALGYLEAITYTLPDESGASLRAAGFVLDSIVDPPERGWETRPKQLDLLGTPHRPDGPKLRWRRPLRP